MHIDDINELILDTYNNCHNCRKLPIVKYHSRVRMVFKIEPHFRVINRNVTEI